MNNAIAAHVRKALDTEDEANEFISAWQKTVLYALTIPSYREAWIALQVRFLNPQYSEIFKYLKAKWIPFKEQIIKCYVDRY